MASQRTDISRVSWLERFARCVVLLKAQVWWFRRWGGGFLWAAASNEAGTVHSCSHQRMSASVTWQLFAAVASCVSRLSDALIRRLKTVRKVSFSFRRNYEKKTIFWRLSWNYGKVYRKVAFYRLSFSTAKENIFNNNEEFKGERESEQFKGDNFR